VYANQRLSLGEEGKAYGGKAKTSNRTGEIPPSGIIGGPRETSPWLGMRTRLAIERAGTVTPHLKRGAPVLYPNPNGNGEKWIGRTYGAKAPVLDPTTSSAPPFLLGEPCERPIRPGHAIYPGIG